MFEIDTTMNPDAWTDPAVKADILALTFTSPEQAVAAILEVLDGYGYDSIDRELSFWIASERLGVQYDALYNAWLKGAR